VRHRIARRGPRCRLVAAGIAAALLLSGAARAQAPEAIAVVLPDGACVLRAAPPGTLAAAAGLAAEAEAIGGFATRLLQDAATMRLAPTRERVPQFGDWAYGWVQSYVTSYRVLARGLLGVADSLGGRGEWPSVARIAEEMSEPIRTEFRARVLTPITEDGGFAPDLAHVGAEVDRAWSRALQATASRLQALPAGQGQAAGRLDLAAAALPLAPQIAAALPPDPLALIADDGSHEATVFLRSMRPMAARLGAVVVRVSETGSLVATGGAFGYALAGVPGTAAGLAGGIGLSWAIDWAFNRIDASLNRRAFEAQALAALDRAEDRLAEETAAVAVAALAQRVAALQAGPGGCP
jgi:hypothetical protein